MRHRSHEGKSSVGDCVLRSAAWPLLIVPRDLRSRSGVLIRPTLPDLTGD